MVEDFTGLPNLGKLKTGRRRSTDMDADLARLTRQRQESRIEVNPYHLASILLDLDLDEVQGLCGIADNRFESIWSGEVSPSVAEMSKLFYLACLRLDGHDLRELVSEGISWPATLAALADTVDSWEV